MDIRQSPPYAQFIKNLGWQVEKIEESYIFIRKFPLIGSLIKIQRIKPPIPFAKIEKLAQRYRAFRVVIEPEKPSQYSRFGYQLYLSPFIPSKTLVLDIDKPWTEVSNGFSKNKRRDLRLAEKNNLIIKEGEIDDFIKLKEQYLINKFILPLGTRQDIRRLCQAFGAKAKILTAYLSQSPHAPLAGALILLCDRVAYYWQAAAGKKGKKYLAPTLIVGEAIKLAIKEGCRKFDFEGVADPRFPEQTSWQGFTHFKEGFRGKEVLYPPPVVKHYLKLPFLKQF